MNESKNREYVGRRPVSRRNGDREGLRRLPSVERLICSDELVEAQELYSRALVVDAARAVLEEMRGEIGDGAATPSFQAIVARVRSRSEQSAAGSLRQVINATGVIIHTNLGRVPLSDEAIAAMASIAGGYSNLEYDLEAGERGSRHQHLEDLLCRLTGAEAAMAVNNNAAAVLLALAALASEREVIIARGQLVEIGGGFRVPDVLRQSGARLVEVGTTNRTYIEDYAAAITPQSALLLRVHPSNFRVVGFTHDVPLKDLAELANRSALAVVDDLGSGALLDSAKHGLAHEPMPQESVAAGAGLVCFSGDKLLGGPQAGIVVGRKDLVEPLKGHPLARAMRLDKASIAGLQTTLLHYRRGEAEAKLPGWRMIAARSEEIDRRAQELAGKLKGWGIAAEAIDSLATVGGGSLPGETLPSRAVAIREVGRPANELAALLRRQLPPVVGRVERDSMLLDLRTVLPGQDEALADALGKALGSR